LPPERDRAPSEGIAESRSYPLIRSTIHRWEATRRLWMGMGTRAGVVAAVVAGARLTTLRLRTGPASGSATSPGPRSRRCRRRRCSRPKPRGRSVSLLRCVWRPVPPSAPRISRGGLLRAPRNLMRAYRAAMAVASAAAVLAAVAIPRGEVAGPALTWAATDPQKLRHAKVAADQHPTVIWERRHGPDRRRSAGRRYLRPPRTARCGACICRDVQVWPQMLLASRAPIAGVTGLQQCRIAPRCTPPTHLATASHVRRLPH